MIPLPGVAAPSRLSGGRGGLLQLRGRAYFDDDGDGDQYHRREKERGAEVIQHGESKPQDSRL